MKFIRYLGQAFISVYYDITQLILVNILWVLMTLPVITAPGALAGLFYAMNKLAKNEPVQRQTFFEGFQKYFWLSWRWALLNMIVLYVAYLNFEFYRKAAGNNIQWIAGIVIGLIFIWVVMQIFIWPLLIEQNEKRILVAIRQCVLLFFRHPGPIYLIAIMSFLLSLISVWLLGLPWLIFMGSFCAYFSSATILYVLSD